MGSTPKYPKPSQQELGLMTSQKNALDQQQSMLDRQLQQQEMLAPMIYRQLGIEPTYSQGTPSTYLDPATGQMVTKSFGGGEMTGFQETEAYKHQQEMAEKFATQEAEARTQALAAQQDQLHTSQLLMPAQLEQMGYKGTFGEDGKLTGIEKLPQTESARLQGELETQYYQRAQQAMRGELPVDPTLQRQLDEGKADVHAQLLKQLGPGYESTTAGIQALAEYDKRKAEAIFAAQHGEIGAATQGGLATGAANTKELFANLAGTQSTFNPGMTTAQNLLGTTGAGPTPGQNISNLIGGVSAQYNGSQGLGTLAQLYGQAQNPYASQRNNEYQADVMRNRTNAMYTMVQKPAENMFQEFGSSFGRSAGSMSGGGGGFG